MGFGLGQGLDEAGVPPGEVVAADEVEGVSLGDELPSGDELAAELEKFLRGEAN